MPQVAAVMQQLAAHPGIEGCVLVEAGTGMLWHHSGACPDIERIGEAAIEFWRVEKRLSAQLQTLGQLRSVAYSFSNRVVAMFPCSEALDLVLVCVATKGPMSWAAWGEKVVLLQRALTEPDMR